MPTPEFEHLSTVVGGLACLALGMGWLPTRWTLGNWQRRLFAVGGLALVLTGAALYLTSANARTTSWYALNINTYSCPTLYEQVRMSTPEEVIVSAGCQASETNAPGATRLYCPREQVYLYLYPEREGCEDAAATFRANAGAFDNEQPN
jgi:hypothetical protein